MIKDHQISVIIPALNEADSIARVIGEIPHWVDETIVVDNGSTDETASIARTLGAKVIHEIDKGYGAACLAGIKAIDAADLIGFVDGDYSDYPADLEKLFMPLINGKCDLAIGCRTDRWKNVVPFHQRWGNWLACRTINLFHGSCFQDLGPMRCIKKSVLDKLEMRDKRYGWTSEMQIKANQMGFTVLEFPVRYRKRIGNSKISGTVKGSVLAGWWILFWTFKLVRSGSKPVS